MKHGRKELPFTRVPGHIFSDDATQVSTMQYMVTCAADGCDSSARISAPRNLPDKVVVRKFEKMGWVGEGHRMRDIPRKLLCQQHETEKELSMDINLEQKTENRNAYGSSKPHWAEKHASLTSLVEEAVACGMETGNEVLAYINTAYRGEVNPSSISGILTNVRDKLGLPRKRRRRLTASQAVDPAKCGSTEPEREGKALAALFADGIDLTRLLNEWIKEMQAHGIKPGVSFKYDDDDAFEGIRLSFYAD